jgi:catechol 2,3-dioxygenase
LYESRYALAEALKRVISAAPFLYSGSADHLVSNAFYFTDPEGNGVELYFDTNPGTWEWKDGRIVMGSKHLDINEFIKTNNVKKGSQIIKPGHVHLKVGDIEDARKFYVDILGLHLTALMPSALFISDGMYHHHIGMNVWESAGAGKRGTTLGLRSFEIKITEQKELAELKARLKKANVGYKDHPSGISIQDPWDTTLIVSLD